LDISINCLEVHIMDPGDGWIRGGSVEERWKKEDLSSVSVLPNVFIKVTRFQSVDTFGSVVTEMWTIGVRCVISHHLQALLNVCVCMCSALLHVFTVCDGLHASYHFTL
jgi:hypothetical protein